MGSRQHTASFIALLAAGGICLLAYVPRDSAMAGSPALTATANLGAVRAVGVTDGRPPIYVATDTGLYRATSQTYAFWSRQRAITDVLALAPNPYKPQDLVYTRFTGLFRSTDGGRTARYISPACNDIALARSTRVPTLIYGGSPFGCGRQPVNGYPGTYSLQRSADDGLSWTTVFTDVDSYIYDHNANFGRIAIDPTDPHRVFAADTNARDWGELLDSTDDGRHWTVVQDASAAYTTPTDIAIDPLNPADVWVAWGGAGVYHSLDRGHTWHRITRGLPPLPDVTAVQVDPLTGRAYISLSLSASDTNSTGLYAIGKGERVEAFALVDQGYTSGYSLQITRNGYLLAWHYLDPGYLTLISPPNSASLTVRPLIGSGTWAVSAVFTSTVALRAAHLLGAPLSPTTTCAGQPCQYFAKGALAAGPSGSYSYVVLVPRLIGAQRTLPVGASVSSLTYRDLYTLHNQRTPLPAGLRHGTLAVHGGTFVPYSATLAAASGYVVPVSFWRYLTDARQAPDGWQSDFGLPLTPAVAATVTKGKLGTRHILVQAFQKAILTDDPRNPALFRVERANVGADYAAAFPASVR